MESLPPNVNFTYEGSIAPDQVAAVFQGADAFLFPTKGKNFGHVIAEALAEGCPVITTPTTIWTSLLRHGARLTFDDNREAVTWLENLAGHTREQRGEGTQRAQQLYRNWRQGDASKESLFSAALEARDPKGARHVVVRTDRFPASRAPMHGQSSGQWLPTDCARRKS